MRLHVSRPKFYYLQFRYEPIFLAGKPNFYALIANNGSRKNLKQNIGNAGHTINVVCMKILHEPYNYVYYF